MPATGQIEIHFGRAKLAAVVFHPIPDGGTRRGRGNRLNPRNRLPSAGDRVDLTRLRDLAAEFREARLGLKKPDRLHPANPPVDWFYVKVPPKY